MLSVLTIILFSAQMFIPPVGIAVAYFSVLPLAFIKIEINTRYYVMAILTSGIIIMLLNDPFGWIFFWMLLLPVITSVLYKNILLKILMFCVNLLGIYLLYNFFNVGTSQLDVIFSKLWYIIAVGFYFLTYFFYKRSLIISKNIIKKTLNK